jgi:hypothetical protein
VDSLAEGLHAVLADPDAFVVDRTLFATWPDVVAATRQLYERLLAAPRGQPLPQTDVAAAVPLESRRTGL